MKLFVVAAILGVCAADRLDNKYLPPRGGAGSGFNGNLATPNFKSGPGFSQVGIGANYNAPQTYNAPQNYNAPQSYNQYSGQSFRAQASQDASAQILRLNNENNRESFSYDFETSNGIRADASGVATNGVQSQGSFGYKGDDGQDYSITYTADENGYRPQGAHLPTPPPIPEAILKSLEQNARDEAAGISDDGSYHGEGAGSGAYSSYSGSNQGPSTQYGAPASPQYNAPTSQYNAPAPQYNAPAPQYNAPASQYNAPARFAPKPSFGAASRQYIPPNAGPRPSGNGNFNAQSGYRY